jgi:two-component system, chemotaxis family, response regulator WspF
MFTIAIASNDHALASNLRQLLIQVPGYVVNWLAYDSHQVLKKCAEDLPDLLILDVSIQSRLGPWTTQQVMKNFPCVILALTSNPKKDLSLVFDTMGKGAVDVIGVATNHFADRLEAESALKKVKLIAQFLGKKSKESETSRKQTHYPPLVVIGASTGGPLAIAKIISDLSQNKDLAIIIVQHIDEEFAEGFGRWLESRVSLPVELVKEGSFPEAGHILIAGKNLHLVMTEKKTLSYLNNPKESFYCPSIDQFFQSVAINWPKPFAALLLTGMGHDGAKGLKALKTAGWYTIVQNKESSAIFGMPKAAIEAEAVSEILNLSDIGTKILKLLKGQ